MQRPPYLSLTLLSAAILAYEILLIRLFSIIQWHHFAYMIIGLALFGFGISGAIISSCQKWFINRYISVYISIILLFGLTAFFCFYAAQSFPLNIEEVFWDISQSAYLAFIFILLAVPFTVAAAGICLSLMRYKTHTGPVYSASLAGSGIGSILGVLLLYIVHPETVLIIISIFSFGAGLIASIELDKILKVKRALIVVLLSTLLVLLNQTLDLEMSPYKPLQQSLHIDGTKIVKTKTSALGLINVIENVSLPLRHAPGLSLNTVIEPLPQLGVYTDGDNFTAITRYPEHMGNLEYLDQTSSALAYHLSQPKTVLIADAGGGAGVLQALYHGASEIDATETNSQIIELVNKDFQNFSGKLYSRTNVSIHNMTNREFVTHTKNKFDFIQISSPDSYSASSTGLYALNENYSYTTEALKLYLSKLNPGGYLSITSWITLPPKETIKLLATAIRVLKDSSLQPPDLRLILIRSWQTSTLLIKNGLLTESDTKLVLNFCNNRSYDVAYIPNIKNDQVNQYNILNSPIYYQAALALLGPDYDSYLEKYKFNIVPASDNRPYFSNYFKWSAFGEILNLLDKGGMPLVEMGYIALIIILSISIALGVVITIIPICVLLRRSPSMADRMDYLRLFLYFFCIGLSFIMLEIAFINRFLLFLHHPIFSVATIITSFLLFAGIGSLNSGYIAKKIGHKETFFLALVSITSICLLYNSGIDNLFLFFTNQSFFIRVVISIFLLSPLAFFLGMLFPLALSGVLRKANALVPWLWAVNGCASVIGTSLATLLAMHCGFQFVILLSVSLYLIAILTLPKQFTSNHLQ